MGDIATLSYEKSHMAATCDRGIQAIDNTIVGMKF